MFPRYDVRICKPIPFNNLANTDWDQSAKHGAAHCYRVNFAVLSTGVGALRKLRNQVS